MPHEEGKRSRSKSHRSRESGRERHHGNHTRDVSEIPTEKSNVDAQRSGTACQLENVDSTHFDNSLGSCENCHAKEASLHLYCSTCKLVLCNKCDQIVHAPPALSRHERRPYSEASLLRKMCRFHSDQQLSHFCMYCNTCLCKICIDDELHQSSPHIIETIEDAYYKKVRGLSSLASGPLRQRYELLQHEVVRLEGIMQAVRNSAREIEVYTREHYEGVLARLARSEGRKLALCQSDLATVKRMMRQIDDVEKSIAQDQQLKGPLSLLSEAATITESVRSILAQKLTDIVSVTEDNIRPDDLPREVLEWHQLVAADETNTSAQFKSRAFHEQATQTYHSPDLISEREAQLIAEAKEEICHWKALVEQYATELDAWNMVCSHCGQKCLPETLNSPCLPLRSSLHDATGVTRERGELRADTRNTNSPFLDDLDQSFPRHSFVRPTNR